MFEKANPLSSLSHAMAGGLRAGPAALRERFDGRPEPKTARRAGEALRAVEWSELTARLNAARDLRLLMRNEAQAPIEAVAASFGDAAASYFALIDDDERDVNLDALGQSKVFDGRVVSNEANRPGDAADQNAGAARGDARDMQ
jgi:hypothetical protein